jgi:hypothetical protein
MAQALIARCQFSFSDTQLGALMAIVKVKSQALPGPIAAQFVHSNNLQGVCRGLR